MKPRWNSLRAGRSVDAVAAGLRGYLKMLGLFGLTAGIAMGCRTPQPSMPEPRASGAERLAEMGFRQAEAGGLEGAIRHYRAALDAALAADTPAVSTRLASALAVSLAAAGELNEAHAMARVARAEAVPETIDRWTAELIEARVAWLLGDDVAADRLAERVWRAPGMVHYPSLRAEAGVLSAEAAIRRGDAESAAERLRAAQRMLPADAPFSLRAVWHAADGRQAVLTGRPTDAAAAFDHEATLWRDAGRPFEMALALESAGNAWRMAQQPQTAADRYFRAGRGLHHAGRTLSATRLLRQARELASAAEDAGLLQRIDAWGNAFTKNVADGASD